MYVNGKMRPVETIPEMGVEGVKSRMVGARGGEFMCDIFDIL
jgi:hypothetical protein